MNLNRTVRLMVLGTLLTATATACGGGDGAGGEAAGTMPLPGSEAAPAPSYTVPEGWVNEEPANSMRVAQFRLPGIEGAGDAELVISHFRGSGGSVRENIDRWIGQFTQPDGRPSSEVAVTGERYVGDIRVAQVTVTGTYNPGMMSGSGGSPRDESRLLGAILVQPDGPWFYKLVGPRVTVDRWVVSFDEFLNSLRVVQ